MGLIGIDILQVHKGKNLISSLKISMFSCPGYT